MMRVALALALLLPTAAVADEFVAEFERIFREQVATAPEYATDIDREQLRAIVRKFDEGLKFARSDNPKSREIGLQWMEQARQQLDSWFRDVWERRRQLELLTIREMSTPPSP